MKSFVSISKYLKKILFLNILKFINITLTKRLKICNTFITSSN